jgi:hypothetical protein
MVFEGDRVIQNPCPLATIFNAFGNKVVSCAQRYRTSIRRQHSCLN